MEPSFSPNVAIRRRAVCNSQSLLVLREAFVVLSYPIFVFGIHALILGIFRSELHKCIIMKISVEQLECRVCNCILKSFCAGILFARRIGRRHRFARQMGRNHETFTAPLPITDHEIDRSDVMSLASVLPSHVEHQILSQHSAQGRSL